MEGIQFKDKVFPSSTYTQVTTVQRVLWICNTFYYQILASITFVAFWLFFNSHTTGRTLFTMHLVCSTAAYVPLMAVSIILFSEDNVTTLYIPRTSRNWVHGVLLLISTLLVTIGIGVETHLKNLNNGKHFVSNHAILGKISKNLFKIIVIILLGLASWILVFVSVLLGVAAAQTRNLSKYVRPIVTKFIHNLLGISAFLIGMVSIWYERRAFQRYGLPESALSIFEVGFVFITIWSLLAAFKSLFAQVKGVFHF
ncbi:hypothetical protein ABEB36_003157 [Hypothenemus hampei]|uniref:ascorbate ferrireductase (transmembrane) n=1 Tax=Hypothenemus hampei TaxID=57062 RepID=A0ABD1F8X2_HYPHA